MKSYKKILSLALSLFMLCGLIPCVFAASESAAVIDYDALCSLTLYKFDFTAAEKDGVWDNDKFTSTGVTESYVTDTLLYATRNGADSDESDLENGKTSKGYAIRGVVFSYLRVADVMTYSEVVGGVAKVNNLYGFACGTADDMLAAIGLFADGKYVDNFTAQGVSDKPLDESKVYYTSDVLNKHLYEALTLDATGVKNVLETYIKANSGVDMKETDGDGRSQATGLPVGLYLIVETAVPETVTNTTDPFFVSLPMTTVDGNSNSASATNAGVAGGHFWNYNVVLYPKNETGIPTLEKTVREAVKSSGTNGGSEDITDGYDHNATASTGDTLEWQIISTLPTITSRATALSDLHWVDTVDKGLTYYPEYGVKIQIYSDKDCTNLVDTWDKNSGNFDVNYVSNKDGSHTMTVSITAAGLALINGYGADKNVNSTENTIYTNYSNYTVRITYTTVLNSNASLVFGDEGNDNLVIFTWKRTNSEYFDTLVDDAHVYSFGIDILKLFSDVGHGTQEMYDHVKFLVYNVTDSYWVTAELNEDEGVYYVTGSTDKENLATQFSPVFYKVDGEIGRIVIKGLEDDEYMITEIETADGYTLLTDHRYVEISTEIDYDRPCDIYRADIENYLKGLIQNDPRYSEGSILVKGWAEDNILTNIPQEYLEHFFLTASATVDGVTADMLSSEGAEDGVVSVNALAHLEITNHVKPDLPKTGDDTLYCVSICAAAMFVSGICLIVLPIMKRGKENKETGDHE